jgi:hypothetical protein
MTTWYNHAATAFDPETGLFSEDMKALVTNPIAIAEGDTLAPKIYGLAIARVGAGVPVATVSAADTVGLGYGDGAQLPGTVAGVVLETDIQIYTMPVYTGSARFKIQIVHSFPSGSGSATVRLYKNGSVVYTNTLTVFSATVTRTFDLSFANGDTIKWTAQFAGGDLMSYTALTPTANDGYVAVSPVALVSQL